jgi:hypothetical protein
LPLNALVGFLLTAGFGACLAHAYSLPPKVVTIDTATATVHVNDLPRVEAKSVDLLTKDDLLSGGLFVDAAHARLTVAASDGQTGIEWRLKPDHKSLSDRREFSLNGDSRARLFPRGQGDGGFFAFPDRLAFRPEPNMERDFWSVPLDAELVTLARDAHGSQLNAWSVYPARLLVFHQAQERLFLLRWNGEGEPVAFLPCGNGQSLLVENLDSGLTRLVFFEGERPVRRSEFDWTSNQRRSHASTARSTDCREVFVTGSFGLARVSY